MLIVLGIGYCVGSWRTLAWVCMVPGIVCVTLMAFLHDTPYWLMDKDRKDAAMYYSDFLKHFFVVFCVSKTFLLIFQH
jgi:hypothetical protein